MTHRLNLKPCNNLDLTPTYRRLCTLLSSSSYDLSNNKSNISFTGNYNTDELVLQNLPDKDLISVCQTNKYVNTLCKKEYFWINRVLLNYGKFLGTVEYIEKNYIPSDVSWKDYYFWISSLLQEENLYMILANANLKKRQDIVNIIEGLTDVRVLYTSDIYGTGHIRASTPYKNIKEGSWIYKRSIVEYDNDNKVQSILINSEGNIISIMKMDRQGKPLLFKSYYPNSKLKEKNIYKDGKMISHERFEPS